MHSLVRVTMIGQQEQPPEGDLCDDERLGQREGVGNQGASASSPAIGREPLKRGRE